MLLSFSFGFVLISLQYFTWSRVFIPGLTLICMCKLEVFEDTRQWILNKHKLTANWQPLLRFVKSLNKILRNTNDILM